MLSPIAKYYLENSSKDKLLIKVAMLRAWEKKYSNIKMAPFYLSPIKNISIFMEIMHLGMPMTSPTISS